MADPQTERVEGALTYVRIEELIRQPVQGRFDAAHLKEVHRRIFQDLPHHEPGEFRADSPGYVKSRRLESTGERHHVHYAPRKRVDERLEATLADVQGGRALRSLDPDAFAKRMSKLYGDLDFLHPFKEGNSRTLRAFTTQLAKAAGYALDWTWSGADAQSPDRLYRARDKEVNARAFPGLDQARAAKTDNRVEYEAWVYVLARYRESPDLQTLVREATFSERDLQAARAFKQAATPAELEKAAWRFPVVRPAVERLRLAELFANEKIRDPSSRANFLVDVRERLVKDLSRGKALAEPQRIIDAQREL